MAKFHTLNANSDVVTAAEVSPVVDESLTVPIATIGGKDIKAPAGGGMFYLYGTVGYEGSGMAGAVVGDLRYQQGENFDGRGYFIYKNTDNTLLDRSPDEDSIRLTLPLPSSGNLTCVTSGQGRVLRNGQVVTGTFPVADGDVVHLSAESCLPRDAPVAMADGTERRICDVAVGDMVMSIDPETGLVVPDRVVERGVGRHSIKDVWRFDDGSELETVHRHRFYNVDLGEHMYMEAWNLGERCRRIDGSTPRLESRRRVEGDWEHHTIFTERWNNYFAYGALCGNRRSSRLSMGG